MDTDKKKLELYEKQILQLEQTCHTLSQENSRLRLELMRKNEVDSRKVKMHWKKSTRLSRLADKFGIPILSDYHHDFTYGGRALYTKEELEQQKKHKFDAPVRFSIIVPIYNTDKTMLYEMLCSVADQTYSDYELCIADGSDLEHSYTERICKSVSGTFGGRLKYKKIKNNGISANSNESLSMATGDWIVLLDHDDLLHPSALYSVMRRIEDTGADFVYSDETRFTGIPQNSIDSYPFYKPDYSPDYLLSTNYICHIVAFKRSLLDEGEGFRSEFDGSQDYDLVLRMTEKASRIEHIPQVLYYWRYNESSVSSSAVYNSNSDVYSRGGDAVQSHLDRLGIKATVEHTSDPGYFHVRYDIEGEPKVSIIILNRDHRELLERCVSSILRKSTWKNYEIVICENGSSDPDIFEYYDELRKDPRIVITKWTGSGEFNYSALNNYGVRNAAGDYYLLLNNDTEVITDGWIEELLMQAQRKSTGVVGCMLRYPDNTIQHAGIYLSGGLAMHNGLYENALEPGRRGINRCVINVSAVTGACMMVRKDVWDELGGLNEEYKVAYNDIDLCLRAEEAGYLTVYTPFAVLYHYEGKSRGFRRMEENDISREDVERIKLLTDHPVTALSDRYRNAHYTFDGYYCEYIESPKDRNIARLLAGNRGIPLFVDRGLSPEAIRQLYYVHTIKLDRAEGISLTDPESIKTDSTDYLLAVSLERYNESNPGGIIVAVFDDIVILGFGDKVKTASADAGDFSIASGRFLGSGFHPSESNGFCWSAEEKTTVKVTGIPNGACRFVLLHGYSIPFKELGRQSLTMSIDVNDVHIADISVTGANNGKDITFDVPDKVITDGTANICIQTELWSPADYGSPDRRKLGFSTSGIKALTLNKTE